MPTRQALIPQIVPEERLTSAIAVNSMGMAMVTVVGPALAGVLIAVVGAQGVYYLMAGMYAGSIVLIHLLPRVRNLDDGAGRTLLGDLVDGVRYVRATRQILLLLTLSFSTILFI